ncbi:MAG: ribonuclease domain-containing protein [Rhodocyclaceae bacterium]
MTLFVRVLLLVLLAASGSAWAREDAPRAVTTITIAALPFEARTTLDLIRRGGPYPYRRDGVVFYNREGLLPKRQRGYYHEYTVPTPGSRDRGARRIVTGAADEYYYSGDHYRSFQRIVQ